MSSSPTTSYSAVAMALHWLIGLAIIGMLALGWIMTDMPNSNPDKFALFQLHKSIGISILLLAIFRLIWRLTHTVPPHPPNAKPWQVKLAKGLHILLYALMILMPLTGWVIISTSAFKIRTLLFGAVPWPSLPFLAELENKKAINDLFGDVHGLLAYAIVAAAALHAAAALKHHFVDRDGVLLRMLPQSLHGILKRLNGTAVSVLLALCLALPTPAHAGHPWKIDYEHSRLGFSGVQSGEKFNGEFKKFTVDLDFDPAHPDDGAVTTVIDIASATAGSHERDSYLPQHDWFDTSAFPQAKFSAGHIRSTGDNCFLAPGTLTIKDKSHNVDLPFCLRVVNDITYASGQITVRRSDYNIGINQWDDEEVVSKNVTVIINIAATPG